MRIIILTSNKRGGMIHYVSQMAESLARRGHQVHVIGPEGMDKSFFQMANVHTIPFLTELKDWRRLPKGLFGAAVLAFRLMDERPDVLHINELHPVFAPCALLTLSKHRFSATLHDVRPHPGIRTFERRLFLRYFLMLSGMIFVHGTKSVEEMKEYAEKVREVRHGDYNFLNRDCETGKEEEEEGSVLFFGRIEPYKGLEYLIDAVPTLVKRVKNFKLIIAGSGQIPFREALVGYEDHVEIHNYFIPESEIPALFTRAAVVVLPYIECTQSGVIPIAYSFRRPVIATKVGCIDEVVDESNGILVPPGDLEKLADAIAVLLNDRELRRRLGERGHLQFTEHFSWAETIKIYEEGFKDLIEMERM